MPGKIIVGLDIGTTKICAVVGEIVHDAVEIIGIGSHPSEGLRKGVVINIEKTVNSIKEAIEEAETMAGCEISSVYAGIAGGHIKGFNSHGVIALKEREVTKKDIDRVIEAASAVAIPMDREVIHVLEQEFIVDEQDGILDPLGMSGVRMEALIHIVTGAVTSAQNIIKCANRAGLDVHDIVLESLASSEAVLSDEERNLGVALIDFGGGTTDMAVFSKGSIKHTSVLALGGYNLTYDISIGIRTPTKEAEKIKMKYGCALTSMIGSDETIEVPGVGGREPKTLPRQFLGEIFRRGTRKCLGLRISDITCGLKGFERNAALQMFSRSRIERWGYDTEIMFLGQKLGFPIDEIPVDWYHSFDSKVKMGPAVVKTLVEMVQILTNYCTNRYHLSLASRKRAERP